MARSAAIFGITGSTARENSVEAKITRLTILRTGGMARLFSVILRCERSEPRRMRPRRLGCRPSRAASRPPQGDGPAFELAFGPLVELHQTRKKRLHVLERNHVWPVGRRAVGVLVGLDENPGDAHGNGGARQHRHVFALAAR